MSEIKKVYRVECIVTFTTLKVRKNAALIATVAASWMNLDNESKMEVICVDAAFPTPDGVSMTALVYRLLHKLDYELTDKRFYQTELFPRA